MKDKQEIQNYLDLVYTHSRKASKNFHLLNHHTHRFVDSGTPLYFYSGKQGTAVDVWSCL